MTFTSMKPRMPLGTATPTAAVEVVEVILPQNDALVQNCISYITKDSRTSRTTDNGEVTDGADHDERMVGDKGEKDKNRVASGSSGEGNCENDENVCPNTPDKKASPLKPTKGIKWKTRHSICSGHGGLDIQGTRDIQGIQGNQGNWTSQSLPRVLGEKCSNGNSGNGKGTKMDDGIGLGLGLGVGVGAGKGKNKAIPSPQMKWSRNTVNTSPLNRKKTKKQQTPQTSGKDENSSDGRALGALGVELGMELGEDFGVKEGAGSPSMKGVKGVNEPWMASGIVTSDENKCPNSAELQIGEDGRSIKNKPLTRQSSMTSMTSLGVSFTTITNDYKVWNKRSKSDIHETWNRHRYVGNSLDSAARSTEAKSTAVRSTADRTNMTDRTDRTDSTDEIITSETPTLPTTPTAPTAPITPAPTVRTTATMMTVPTSNVFSFASAPESAHGMQIHCELPEPDLRGLRTTSAADEDHCDHCDNCDHCLEDARKCAGAETKMDSVHSTSNNDTDDAEEERVDSLQGRGYVQWGEHWANATSVVEKKQSSLFDARTLCSDDSKGRQEDLTLQEEQGDIRRDIDRSLTIDKSLDVVAPTTQGTPQQPPVSKSEGNDGSEQTITVGLDIDQSLKSNTSPNFIKPTVQHNKTTAAADTNQSNVSDKDVKSHQERQQHQQRHDIEVRLTIDQSLKNNQSLNVIAPSSQEHPSSSKKWVIKTPQFVQLRFPKSRKTSGRSKSNVGRSPQSASSLEVPRHSVTTSAATPASNAPTATVSPSGNVPAINQEMQGTAQLNVSSASRVTAPKSSQSTFKSTFDDEPARDSIDINERVELIGGANCEHPVQQPLPIPSRLLTAIDCTEIAAPATTASPGEITKAYEQLEAKSKANSELVHNRAGVPNLLSIALPSPSADTACTPRPKHFTFSSSLSSDQTPDACDSCDGGTMEHEKFDSSGETELLNSVGAEIISDGSILVTDETSNEVDDNLGNNVTCEVSVNDSTTANDKNISHQLIQRDEQAVDLLLQELEEFNVEDEWTKLESYLKESDVIEGRGKSIDLSSDSDVGLETSMDVVKSSTEDMKILSREISLLHDDDSASFCSNDGVEKEKVDCHQDDANSIDGSRRSINSSFSIGVTSTFENKAQSEINSMWNMIHDMTSLGSKEEENNNMGNGSARVDNYNDPSMNGGESGYISFGDAGLNNGTAMKKQESNSPCSDFIGDIVIDLPFAASPTTANDENECDQEEKENSSYQKEPIGRDYCNKRKHFFPPDKDEHISTPISKIDPGTHCNMGVLRNVDETPIKSNTALAKKAVSGASTSIEPSCRPPQPPSTAVTGERVNKRRFNFRIRSISSASNSFHSSDSSTSSEGKSRRRRKNRGLFRSHSMSQLETHQGIISVDEFHPHTKQHVGSDLMRPVKSGSKSNRCTNNETSQQPKLENHYENHGRIANFNEDKEVPSTKEKNFDPIEDPYPKMRMRQNFIQTSRNSTANTEIVHTKEVGQAYRYGSLGKNNGDIGTISSTIASSSSDVELNILKLNSDISSLSMSSGSFNSEDKDNLGLAKTKLSRDSLSTISSSRYWGDIQNEFGVPPMILKTNSSDSTKSCHEMYGNMISELQSSLLFAVDSFESVREELEKEKRKSAKLAKKLDAANAANKSNTTDNLEYDASPKTVPIPEDNCCHQDLSCGQICQRVQALEASVRMKDTQIVLADKKLKIQKETAPKELAKSLETGREVVWKVLESAVEKIGDDSNLREVVSEARSKRVSFVDNSNSSSSIHTENKRIQSATSKYNKTGCSSSHSTLRPQIIPCNKTLPRQIQRDKRMQPSRKMENALVASEAGIECILKEAVAKAEKKAILEMKKTYEDEILTLRRFLLNASRAINELQIDRLSSTMCCDGRERRERSTKSSRSRRRKQQPQHFGSNQYFPSTDGNSNQPLSTVFENLSAIAAEAQCNNSSNCCSSSRSEENTNLREPVWTTESSNGTPQHRCSSLCSSDHLYDTLRSISAKETGFSSRNATIPATCRSDKSDPDLSCKDSFSARKESRIESNNCKTICTARKTSASDQNFDRNVYIEHSVDEVEISFCS